MSANNQRYPREEFAAGRPAESATADVLVQALLSGQVRFQNLSGEQQLAAYAELNQSGESPAAVLLRLSQGTPHDFTHIVNNSQIPMDRAVYRLRPGHRVMITHETSASGVSRASAAFIDEVVTDSLADPTVTVAQMPNMIDGMDAATLSQDELETALLAYAEAGLAQDIGVDAKYTLLETLGSQQYARTTLIGTITETPYFVDDSGQGRMFNRDGIICITDLEGNEVVIEQCNARMIHVIGIDHTSFLAQQTTAHN